MIDLNVARARLERAFLWPRIVSDRVRFIVGQGRPLADVPLEKKPNNRRHEHCKRSALFYTISMKLIESCSLQQPVCSQDEDGPDRDDGDLAVAPAKPKLKRPPLYRVILLNDDYTPMEFVVYVLEQFFSMGREKATQVMLAVHTQGKGVCGIYPQDIAETKASQVNQSARDSGHPLLCEVEPSNDDED